jgi:hypothetical protein
MDQRRQKDGHRRHATHLAQMNQFSSQCPRVFRADVALAFNRPFEHFCANSYKTVGLLASAEQLPFWQASHQDASAWMIGCRVDAHAKRCMRVVPERQQIMLSTL